ncbi:MAG: poly(A) polymerase, partial [Candidatus Magasanikbacteria bacterium]|nr:poly(A) polymerase [Candidatus Magasanikbacteria bacterium]
MKEKYHRPQIEEVKLDFDKLAEVREKSPYFRWIKDFKKEFPKAGVFLVGGSVRDIILNRSSKDYDFIVRGVSAAHLKNFLATHGRVDLTGSTFGVFKFRGQGFDHEIDIALPRREQAGASGGYRDVETQSDPEMPIEGDLGRRDFTVNAMAWDSESGQVIDPWKGVLDLKSRVIRAVGDPSARFGEDYSRMLRALRQAAQFNFSIEEKTLSAIKELIGKINASAPGGKEEQRLVPYEVISREFLKGFVSDPVRTIDLWAETGALKEVFPEILELKKCAQSPDYHSEGDVFTHSRLALEKTRSPEFKKYFPEAVSARALVAILFHDIGKPETAKKEKDSARPGGFHISFHGHEKVGA